jgi:D-glycero-alpha-D-manno-heptose-7-phosphate kinase
VTQKELAKDAAALGMDILCDPIGKQDSYAAAFGGLNFFVFSPDEEVTVERLEIPESLNLRLLMFRIGAPHDSHEILRDQVSRPNHASVAKMAKLAQELRESIIAGRIEDFGPILHENWMLKKELSPLISNTWVDVNYRRALDAGATGGKLLGAGGGGYLLVYCEPTHSEEVIRALSHLTRLYYSFDTLGTRAIVWE